MTRNSRAQSNATHENRFGKADPATRSRHADQAELERWMKLYGNKGNVSSPTSPKSPSRKAADQPSTVPELDMGDVLVQLEVTSGELQQANQRLRELDPHMQLLEEQLQAKTAQLTAAQERLQQSNSGRQPDADDQLRRDYAAQSAELEAARNQLQQSDVQTQLLRDRLDHVNDQLAQSLRKSQQGASPQSRLSPQQMSVNDLAPGSEQLRQELAATKAQLQQATLRASHSGSDAACIAHLQENLQHKEHQLTIAQRSLQELESSANHQLNSKSEQLAAAQLHLQQLGPEAEQLRQQLRPLASQKQLQAQLDNKTQQLEAAERSLQQLDRRMEEMRQNGGRSRSGSPFGSPFRRQLEEKDRKLRMLEEQLASSERLYRSPDGRERVDEAYGKLEKMQQQLLESHRETQQLRTQLLGDTENYVKENRDLRAQVTKLESELKFSNGSEAEATKLRRKLTDMQSRLKHCASNEAEEMVTLRQAKQQAEIDGLASKKQVRLAQEQLREQERQIAELSTSLSSSARKVASRDKNDAEASVLSREVRELRSKLSTAEADAAQRLRGLLDTRDEAAVAAQQHARRIAEMERKVDESHRQKTEDRGSVAVAEAETRGQLEASRRLREVSDTKLAAEVKRNTAREKDLTQRVKSLSEQLEAARVEVVRGIESRETALGGFDRIKVLEKENAIQEAAEKKAKSQLQESQELIRRMEGRGGPTGLKREFLDFEGAEREMKAEIRLLRGKVSSLEKDNGWVEKAAVEKQLEQAHSTIGKLKRHAPLEIEAQVQADQLIDRGERAKNAPQASWESKSRSATPAKSASKLKPGESPLNGMRQKRTQVQSQLEEVKTCLARSLNAKQDGGRSPQRERTVKFESNISHTPDRSPSKGGRAVGGHIQWDEVVAPSTGDDAAHKPTTDKQKHGRTPKSKRFQLSNKEEEMLRRAGI